MPRTFYSDYVQHCMRFYAKYPEPNFINDVDKENWVACERALKDFSKWAKDILTMVYRENNTLADNVYRISKKQDVEQDKVWSLIHKLERKVAEERGLI